MPLALVGLGLAAAGTATTLAANAKSQSAINSARAAGVAQQTELQNKNNAIVQPSIAASTPRTAQQEIAAGANARQSAWQSLQDATTPIASALPVSDDPTSKAQSRAGAAGSAWNKIVAGNVAKQGGYGDWQNEQAIKNADASRKIGVNDSFAQQDAALLPTELNVASQAGDKLGAWGSIMSSLGSLAGLAGATGAFASTAGTGVSAGQNAALLNEFNGTGAPGMVGGAEVLPASNMAWDKIYA